VTVLQRVRDVHENDVELRNQFTYSLRVMSSVYTGALTRHGPFTLFLVTDAGFHRSLTGSEVLYGPPDIMNKTRGCAVYARLVENLSAQLCTHGGGVRGTHSLP